MLLSNKVTLLIHTPTCIYLDNFISSKLVTQSHILYDLFHRTYSKWQIIADQGIRKMQGREAHGTIKR